MGARFRLKASFDVTPFSATTQVILRAFQKYGLVLADAGSNWFFQGVSDTRWPDSVFSELGSIAGSNFEAVDTLLMQVNPDSGQAALPGSMSSPRLVNIATRGRVQTGANVLIAGFIIGGSTPKKVLVTARGPSVAVLPSEVPLLMADPKMTLYNASGPFDSNDDWQSRANWQDIPTTMRPGSNKDAAILATLNPGAYTAIVEGVGGGTGLAIVEVFEVENPDIPLINIATRGKVETGANVVIAGFIVGGTANKTVLVTARGPSVAVLDSEKPLLMADPKLTLYNASGPFDANDDWQSRPNAADIPLTQRPGSNKDAAILVSLPPGAYTAIVEGVGGTSGIAIVEVFAQ